MPDPRFFVRAAPLSIAQLADIAKAEVPSGYDSGFAIKDVAPLDKATSDDLSFFDNIRYKKQLQEMKAGACIISPEFADLLPAETIPLLSKTPYKSYALAAQAFYPESLPEPFISKHAHIHETSAVGQGCLIEDGAVIAEGAIIGEKSVIEANVVIGRNVRIGAGCRIGAGASVSHSLIGDNVRLYPGCRIGQDGFGFAIDKAGYVKVPQLGRVIIEDGVEIGANTTIDRGAGPDTIIGQGTWIDNLVQIGHNVKIGKGCIIVAQVGISGSTVLEDYVVLAGQAGIAGHLHIGTGAKIAAQSGVMRNIPAGEEHMGSPSLPLRQYMRQVATLNRLIKKKSS